MITTSNYGLKKPGPDDFYNIDDHNYNSDKIDTQLKTNETNTASNTQQIGVLSDKVNYKVNNWRIDADIPSLYGTEKTIFLSTNAFLGISNALVETTRISAHVVKQVVSQYGNQPIKYRLGTGTDWGEVKTIATTEKTEILCPFNSIYKEEEPIGWRSRIVKDCIGNVTIYLNCIKADKTPFEARNHTLFTLPTGYRASTNIAVYSNDFINGGFFRAYIANGNVCLDSIVGTVSIVECLITYNVGV